MSPCQDVWPASAVAFLAAAFFFAAAFFCAGCLLRRRPSSAAFFVGGGRWPDSCLRRSSIWDCRRATTSFVTTSAASSWSRTSAWICSTSRSVFRAAALDELVDQRLGLLGLDLAGLHEIT